MIIYAILERFWINMLTLDFQLQKLWLITSD